MKLIKNFISIFILLSVSAFAETKDDFNNWKKQMVPILESKL